MRHAYGELPARIQDWRSDLATRGLWRWRFADANRSRHRTLRRRLGHEQLAGHRQLFLWCSCSGFNPLRWTGSDYLFGNGQAGASSADWAGEALLAITN